MTISIQTDPASVSSVVLPWINLVFTLVTACVAIKVYLNGVRARRAEWLTKIYEKFYENGALTEMREAIDCTSEVDKAKLKAIVEADDVRLYAYLNFFEYVSFLLKDRHLRVNEVEDMFGYHLDMMAIQPPVKEKIQSKALDFELLRAFYAKRKPRR